MAVSSSSASEHNVSDENKQQYHQIEEKINSNSTSKKEVRVNNGASENGKTCHQCRQKTRNFAASCNNQRNNKPCPLTFCQTCLLNRYGEKAQDVEALKEWSCPKCRGNCNCSFCRKKSGHQPTGVLLHRAKATGYSSVSEFLQVTGAGNFGYVKSGKDMGASPKNLTASEKETLIASPRKWGKENSLDRRIVTNLDPLPSTPNPVENKLKKMKQEWLGNLKDGNLEDVNLSKGSPFPDEKKPKKIKQGTLKKMHAGQGDGVAFLKQTGTHADEQTTKKLKCEELSKMHDGAFLEGSPKKPRTSNESENMEVKTNEPKKIKQETSKNMHAGQEDGVAFLKQTNLHADEQKTKQLKREELIEMHDGALVEGSCKKPRTSNESENKEVKTNEIPMKDAFDLCRNKKNNVERQNKTHNIMDTLDSKKNQNDGAQHKMVIESHKDKRNGLQFQSSDLDVDILLCDETELTTVAGVELPLKDVGNALQLLEFCAAFGKVLNLKKGQSKFILQELINGRSRLLRQEQYSLVVQFHIELLSLLQEESGSSPQTFSPTQGKNYWFRAFKNYISGSQNALTSLPFDSLDGEAGGYDTLDSSTRLRLLNYLCDEVLETVKIRNWIDDQNLRVAEKAKKAKERVLAAKEKEKCLRQKMLDEVAQAIIAKNGVPLSISEHDEIVCQIKSEAAQAHAELLGSMGMVPKKNQRPNAVRTEPVLVDLDGRAYWRLNGYFDKSNILIQDIGTGDDIVAPGEKWYAFDAEQEKLIEKHISFWERRPRAQTATEIIPSVNTET